MYKKLSFKKKLAKAKKNSSTFDFSEKTKVVTVMPRLFSGFVIISLIATGLYLVMSNDESGSDEFFGDIDTNISVFDKSVSEKEVLGVREVSDLDVSKAYQSKNIGNYIYFLSEICSDGFSDCKLGVVDRNTGDRYIFDSSIGDMIGVDIASDDKIKISDRQDFVDGVNVVIYRSSGDDKLVRFSYSDRRVSQIFTVSEGDELHIKYF